MNRDGSNPRMIFANGWGLHLCLPMGRRFCSPRSKTASPQLFSINLDGSGLQQVSDLPLLRGRSDWSPDGRFIVTYSGRAWERELFLLPLDGAPVRQLTPPGGNSQGPAFSPDGQWVVFTAYFDRFRDVHGCEIYKIRLDGSGLTRLTHNDYCDWQPRCGTVTMTRILLAEDDDMLRRMTRAILEISGYEVFAYPNGQAALEAFEQINPDLVVSDISMPILNGFQLLEAVRKLPSGSVVPFLFLSALSEHDDVYHAKRLGVDDYLFKPFQPEDLLVAVEARLERRRAAELFDSHQAHLQTITLLANVIEARDVYTRGHVERVQQSALELGNALGWPLEDRLILEFGALLHDVGKISIPEAVLNKPGPLTPEERHIMQQHTVAGARIIENVPHLRPAKPYVLSHHERWDGAGYPEGLAGNDIPRAGRLMAIVDVYDALTSDRPYHKGMPPKPRSIFSSAESGRHFDLNMLPVFIEIQKKNLGKG